MPRPPQPHFEEKKNQWYIYFRYKKHFLCTGKSNWLKAMRVAEKILGAPVDQGEPKTLAEGVEQWLLKHGTEWKRLRLLPFLEFVEDDGLRDVTDELLVDYLAYLKRTGFTRKHEKRGEDPRYRTYAYSAKSLRTMISLAGIALAWMAVPPRRWIETVPVRPEHMPRPKKLYRDVPREKLRNAFASLTGRAARAGALCRFIVNVGCRPAEACLLTWDQIDWAAGIVRLEEHKTDESTGQDRILYLTPDAIEVLKAQPRTESEYVFLSHRGKPYNPKSIRSFMRRRGIKRAYDLRHTYAQHARESGVPIDVLQKHLGHKHLSTTQIYAQVRDHQAAAAAHSLAGPLQPPPAAEAAQPTASASSPGSQADRKSNRRKRSTGPARRSSGRRGASRRRSA